MESSFANVKTITVDGVSWHRAKDVAKILGYANTKQAIIKNVDEDDKNQLVNLTTEPLIRNEKQTIYINERGLKQLIIKSQMPNASNIAKQFGINVETKYLRKEIEVVGFIQEYLTCLKIPFEFQKRVKSYRIDLYLPDHKLALEIDEHGHADRDIEYETKREKVISKALHCEFLRINPDADGFKMSHCIASLTQRIFCHKLGSSSFLES